MLWCCVVWTHQLIEYLDQFLNQRPHHQLAFFNEQNNEILVQNKSQAFLEVISDATRSLSRSCWSFSLRDLSIKLTDLISNRKLLDHSNWSWIIWQSSQKLLFGVVWVPVSFIISLANLVGSSCSCLLRSLLLFFSTEVYHHNSNNFI